MWLGPDEFPRSVFSGEVSVVLVCLIMKNDASIQILCLPDIKLAVRILQDVNPKDGSAGSPDKSGEPTIPTRQD
jgi:hypothetical protein